MPVYAALLQGVNIGAKKRIAMAELRALVEAAGAADVRTYVNSGNVVLSHREEDAAALEARLEEVLGAHVGLPVPVLLRSADELDRVVADNPFPAAAAEPRTLHVTFLRRAPAPEAVRAVEAMDTGPDRVVVRGRELYAFLPHLMSGATVDLQRLAGVLGVDGTARNWNTVTRLAQMTRALV